MTANTDNETAPPERIDGVKLRHETLKTITTAATGSLVILIAFKNAYGTAFIVTNWLKGAVTLLSLSLVCSILAMHAYADIMCDKPESLWAFLSTRSFKYLKPLYADYMYRLAVSVFIISIGCLFGWAAQLLERLQ